MRDVLFREGSLLDCCALHTTSSQGCWGWGFVVPAARAVGTVQEVTEGVPASTGETLFE